MKEQHDAYDRVEITYVTTSKDPLAVKKQLWNPATNQFESTSYYHVTSKLSAEQRDWLWSTFGPPRQYHSRVLWDQVQDRLVMCSEVYMMYKLRWGCK